MRISDWSSDVCSSDLSGHRLVAYQQVRFGYHRARDGDALRLSAGKFGWVAIGHVRRQPQLFEPVDGERAPSCRRDVGPQRFQRFRDDVAHRHARVQAARSEEHTSELQSLMRISYAVFCLKKKK